MPLTRADVLARALALLDEVGLEALTMRRLAASLGVQPGAIYWHFASKQALQDAMSDALLDGLLEPPLEGRWDEQLAELARRVLRAVSRHRDGARVAAETLAPGPKALEVAEAMLRILSEGGLRGTAGLWASGVLMSYIVGFSLDVEAMKAMEVRGIVSMLRSLRKTLDRARYPHLLGMSDALLASVAGTLDVDARFEFGLRLILNGLRTTPPPRRSPPRRRRVAR